MKPSSTQQFCELLLQLECFFERPRFCNYIIHITISAQGMRCCRKFLFPVDSELSQIANRWIRCTRRAVSYRVETINLYRLLWIGSPKDSLLIAVSLIDQYLPKHCCDVGRKHVLVSPESQDYSQEISLQIGTDHQSIIERSGTHCFCRGIEYYSEFRGNAVEFHDWLVCER